MKPKIPPPASPASARVIRQALPRMLGILALGSALGFAFNASNPLGVRWAEASKSPRREPAPPLFPTNSIPAAGLAPAPGGSPGPTTTGGASSVASPPPAGSGPASAGVPGPMGTNAVAHFNAPSPTAWAEVKGLLKENRIVLVDARSRPAFEAGHIPGAVCLPEDSGAADFEAFRARYGTNAHVVTYCSSTSCSLSFKLAYKLAKDYGFDRTQFMTGGYFEYQRDAGLADSSVPPAGDLAADEPGRAISQIAAGATTVRGAVPAPGGVFPPNPQPMSWAKVEEWILQRQALLVDTRPAKAFEAGHVPGAVSLPSGSTAETLGAFRQQYGTNRPVILYGEMGGAMQAFLTGRQLMRETGFTSVRFVTEGYKEWLANQGATAAP